MGNLIFDYKNIFQKVEKTLRKYSELSDKEFDKIKNNYNNLIFKKLDDNDYFNLLKLVVFYSGFRAAIVNNRINLINHYFPDYDTVAKFNNNDVKRIMSDRNMIKSKRKINAIINIAKEMQVIITDYKSFYLYLNSFKPDESLENILILRKDLMHRFDFIGPVTSYHFLMELGLNVLKPDRVLTRIFNRLGLIENREMFSKTIFHGRKFAEASNCSIRYIDIIFINYGLLDNENGEFNLQKDICTESNPKCNICGANKYCNYYNSRS